MRIIGISGYSGSGKTTIANYLVARHQFTRLCFASAVKDVVAASFGWDREWLEGTSPVHREWREVPDPFWSDILGKPITPRYALQYIGTDVFRNIVHQDIWAYIVIAKIRAMGPDARVVIDDVRFMNERKVLSEAGATFLTVLRPGPETLHPTPIHEDIWWTAFSDAPRPLAPKSEWDELHPSEWNWLMDPLIASVPVIINSKTITDLWTAVDSWYTTITRRD